MNIAGQIKAFYVDIAPESGSESIIDYDLFIAECEEKSVDIDQDWDNGSTRYTFVDGSVIVWHESQVYVYGSDQ